MGLFQLPTFLQLWIDDFLADQLGDAVAAFDDKVHLSVVEEHHADVTIAIVIYPVCPARVLTVFTKYTSYLRILHVNIYTLEVFIVYFSKNCT